MSQANAEWAPHTPRRQLPSRSTKLSDNSGADSDAIIRYPMQALFARPNDLCDFAFAIHSEARIVWINDKHRSTLGVQHAGDAIGCEAAATRSFVSHCRSSTAPRRSMSSSTATAYKMRRIHRSM